MGVGGQPRWPGRLALALALMSVACAAGALALELLALEAGRPLERSSLSDLLVAVLFPAVGAVILRRDGRNPCGWVMTSCALVGVSALAHQWAYDAGVARPGVLPLGGLAIWLSAWTYWPYWLQPTLLPVLFPHGEVPPGRWRVYVRVVLVVASVGVLASMFKPDDDVEGMGLANPLGIGPPEDVLWAFVGGQAGSVLLLALVATPIAIVGLIRRMRRAHGVERVQLQWLLLGFAACFVLGVLSNLPGLSALFAVGFALIPLGIAVAVLRHGMLDVEVVAGRTIAYGVLTATALLAYAGLVALAGRYVSGDGEGPWLAALVVAAAASARTRVQRWVDRRVFGARRDPHAVVTRVGDSAEEGGVSGLVEGVQEALRLPFVQVLDADGAVVAEAGAPVAGTHVLPVVDRGRDLGVLVIGRRSARERLRPEEESALREVARRAGALLHAQDLQTDLQHAWEQTVRAREEERRRLRRDLHDGLGPALAGMALQLDGLAVRLQDDPALATRAADLRDRLRGTVGEVRGIVDGLRPPPLDQHGLSGALHGLATAPDDPVEVSVAADVPDVLPAAIEVAGYRIAGEAVANALRHAAPRTVNVVAHIDGPHLVIEVRDDGRGFGASATAGVGLRSLHERAAEVGGTLHVTSDAGTGTVVRAALPLGRT